MCATHDVEERGNRKHTERVNEPREGIPRARLRAEELDELPRQHGQLRRIDYLWLCAQR